MLDLGFKKVRTLEDIKNEEEFIHLAKLKETAFELFQECLQKGAISPYFLDYYEPESVEMLKEKINLFNKCLSGEKVDVSSIMEKLPKDTDTKKYIIY